MANNPKVETSAIIKLILDYYKLICSKKTYKSVENKFSSIPLVNARNLLKTSSMNFCTVIEPFFDVSFDNIRTASKLLKVPLDEYVTIITDDGTKIKTDRPVPVGIT